MSDKREDAKPEPEEAPHKVDEQAQEKAGQERSDTGGYE